MRSWGVSLTVCEQVRGHVADTADTMMVTCPLPPAKGQGGVGGENGRLTRLPFGIRNVDLSFLSRITLCGRTQTPGVGLAFGVDLGTAGQYWLRNKHASLHPACLLTFLGKGDSDLVSRYPQVLRGATASGHLHTSNKDATFSRSLVAAAPLSLSEDAAH